MKSSSFTSMFFACMAAGAALAACSGETVTFPGGSGGTGGGGSGGATSSSSSSGAAGGGVGGTGNPTSSSTTSSSSGGGGDGGGDICAQACAKGTECGVPVCDFFPLDCSDPRAECGSQCFLDASCEQIASLPTGSMDRALVSCLTACQQAGGGGGGSGGAPPDGRACGICSIQNSCLPNCRGDAPCQDWLQCAQECLQNDPQPTCFRACDESFPDAAGSYGDAYICACTSCADDCGDVFDPCNARHSGPRGM